MGVDVEACGWGQRRVIDVSSTLQASASAHVSTRDKIVHHVVVSAVTAQIAKRKGERDQAG